MELRTLRYFAAAAQELNMTRAAEKLNISQPPLSNQIKGLENELGTQLFVRGGRRLRLTPEGELLYRRALQILELADKTSAELSSSGEALSGTIALGLIEGFAPFFAADWIAAFHKTYPRVRFSLWNGSGDDVTDRLRKGLADLALIATPYDTGRLDGIYIDSEPWVAIMSSAHPLARTEGDSIDLAALAGQPLIVPGRRTRVEGIRRWFAEIGTEPRILCDTSFSTDAVALSARNAGISIFPQSTYTPDPLVVSKVIKSPMRKIEYYLVWRRDDILSEPAKCFIELAEEAVRTQRPDGAAPQDDAEVL